MAENNSRVGIGDFVRNSIRLSDDEFEMAMRLDNNDKDIDNVGIIALTKDAIESYERS
jgi:hypothetical protein